MTDETRFRATRSMAHLQPVPQGTGGRGVRRFEDPLAELARLIGQDDPFADFVAHKPTPELRRVGSESYRPRAIEPRHDERDFHPGGNDPQEQGPEPQYDSKPSNGAPFQESGPQKEAAPKEAVPYKDTAYDGQSAHPYQHDMPEHDLDSELARLAEPRARTAHYRYGQQPQDQVFPPQPRRGNRFAPPPQDDYDYPEEEPVAPPPRRAPRDYGVPQNGYEQPRNAYAKQGYADEQDAYYEDERYTEQHAYAEQPRPQPKRAPQRRVNGNGYDAGYDEDTRLPAQSEYYKEAPKKGRNWVLISAVAGCFVVLSVTGVVGYRAIFGSSGAPKTIKAETAPAKVAPAPVANTQTAGEPGKSNDRVGFDAPPGNERIVSRQEEPVGRGPAANASPFAPAPQAPAPRQQVQTPPPAAPSGAEGEPKRVRTVSVRADGSVVGDPRASTGGTQQRQQANAPMSINSYAERDSGGPAQQAVQPPPPPNRAPTQQSSSPAPTSGNPWADIPNVQPQRAVPPAQQQASVNNPPPAPRAPAPTIAVQTPMPAGSYVVQVASQKTEQEAAVAWQQVQQRYASVLGGQQAQIRRANLGERGTFYRAQLGPYSNRAQASEICESLKAAGGECIIQRN